MIDVTTNFVQQEVKRAFIGRVLEIHSPTSFIYPMSIQTRVSAKYTIYGKRKNVGLKNALLKYYLRFRCMHKYSRTELHNAKFVVHN